MAFCHYLFHWYRHGVGRRCYGNENLYKSPRAGQAPSKMVACPQVEEMLNADGSLEAISRAILRLVTAGEIDADSADQLCGLIETSRRFGAKTELTGEGPLTVLIRNFDEVDPK